ncbi:MAG: YjgP/YjgQ family permease [bacterium]|nr:YjgP/YjgQ family permease [bacterium]
MKYYFKNSLIRYTTILDRYLIREFAGPFFLAVCGFAIIAIVDILFYLVELAVISGVSFLTVIRLLLYKLPAVMQLFFPMAVLFAVMLLLVRMAKDNELTVLRVSGINVIRVVVPILFLAVITSFLSYLVNEKVVPWANRESDSLIRREVRKKPLPDIVENVVFKGVGERFFYIKKIDPEEGIMQNVLIFEEKARFPRFITAKEARWDEKSWLLMDGYVQVINSEGLVDFVDQFSEMKIHVDQEISNYYRKKTAKEMDSRELKKKIDSLKKGGISTRALNVEYHMKKSIPAACFVFGILGVAFCLVFVRSGQDWWGVILAICISVLAVGFYFFIVALFRAMAKDGNITPFLGVWIPNILYGSLALLTITWQSFRR